MRRFVSIGTLIVFCLLAEARLATAADKEKTVNIKKQIEHGRYLVDLGGCNDCHSPKVISPKGPIPHPMKLLSGFQADQKLPSVPSGLIAPDRWGAVTNNDLTAWVGPWGVSFSANLTPDPATGLGGWTEEMFIATLRKGKHLGTGRDLLPPMPWQNYARMTDADLKDIFAYLHSLPAVANAVPQPVPPQGR